MNIDYLYSVLNLYLKREKDKKTVLTITKGKKYTFSFCVEDKLDDVTKVVIEDEEFNIDLLRDVINIYKDNHIVIDDKYELSKDQKECKYESTLNNGRKLIFKKFNLEEANIIRNIVYNISLDAQELKLDLDNEEKEIPYNLRLREAGFSTFVTIFLIAIWIADIIVIGLWIFKHLS